MTDNIHKVMITEKDEEAAYYAARQIPYIVWLNERNREQRYRCAVSRQGVQAFL